MGCYGDDKFVEGNVTTTNNGGDSTGGGSSGGTKTETGSKRKLFYLWINLVVFFTFVKMVLQRRRKSLEVDQN